MTDLRELLAIPQIYQGFQRAGGFFGARLAAMQRYLPIAEDTRIVDVGCGPGYLRDFLPRSSQYFGFDTDERYIARARKTQQPQDRYRCQIFDEAAATEVAPVDIIMMNGLLHHLTDDEARNLLTASVSALSPGGRIFTLDGCYIPGQTLFRKTLLDWDRGQYVRTAERYKALFPGAAVSLSAYVDEDLSRISYTFLSIVATKHGTS
ncbi:class I SAM-dependent methyltransferase [Tardiphaga sp.]|uniref:class I SAM-dependent methyltransferase n=1 Tax=Tardiphaga sp. TaxID=1926292 RepID=UPI00352AECE0